MTNGKICAVLGVGPGNGAALARRFAQEGYDVALLARSRGYSDSLLPELTPGSRYFACDASDPASVSGAFESIAAEMGAPDVLLYNAGSGGGWASIDDVGRDQFELAWRVNALGLLTAAQAVTPAMKQKGSGSIVITGAIASRRGSVRATAFAAAKAAQRSLAESMAKHLWPAGVHVALIILDGVVDLERSRAAMPDKPDSFFLRAEDLAETAWFLTQQPKSSWSFEVEARPFAEKW